MPLSVSACEIVFEYSNPASLVINAKCPNLVHAQPRGSSNGISSEMMVGARRTLSGDARLKESELDGKVIPYPQQYTAP